MKRRRSKHHDGEARKNAKDNEWLAEVADKLEVLADQGDEVMFSKEPYLTKPRYMAGLQCDKRLWLSWHEPAPYEEPEPGSTLDIGIEIGRKAQLLFPGGILVDEPPWEHTTAVVHTQELMTKPKVPAIFEAAFEHRGIRIRVDVLERLPNRASGTSTGAPWSRTRLCIATTGTRCCSPGKVTRRDYNLRNVR